MSLSVCPLRWYLDEDLLQGANTNQLDLMLSYTHNNKKLSCEGTNAVGSTRETVRLDVKCRSIGH